MKICKYDRVVLKDSNEASIVEILKEEKVFIADIDRNDDTDNDYFNNAGNKNSVKVGCVK